MPLTRLCIFVLVLSAGLAAAASAQSTCTKPDHPAFVDTEYYAPAAGQTGDELKAVLNAIIRGHKPFSYKCVWEILKETDEDPSNPDNIIALYTGRSIPKSRRDQGGGDQDSWNREHTWPKSHGFKKKGQHAHTDAHHLRAADRSVNGNRGNRDFDEGGTAHTECRACRVDSNSWEPPDRVKGDIARMMFYLVVRYEGDDNSRTPDLELTNRTTTNFKMPKLGKLCALFQWHLQDPVDTGEQRRNDVVYSWQGNRNPFIDHPEWVEAIWEESACEPPRLVILGNRRSGVFHLPGCPGYGSAAERNTVRFASVEEATAAGYRRAGNCDQ